MEDVAAIRDMLDAAIEQEDNARAFALGLLYIGEQLEALADRLEPTRVTIDQERGRAGGLDTLFEEFARSPMGKQAQSALGLAPLEPVSEEEIEALKARAEREEADERDAEEPPPAQEIPAAEAEAVIEARRNLREAEDALNAATAPAPSGDPETMPVDLPEDEEPPPDRHPQIPERAWAALDARQKREVDDLVERLLKAERAATDARTPTDEDTYAAAARNLAAELTDEWGIKLLDEAAVDAEEHAGLEGGEIPPPATPQSSPSDLRRRARFLRSRTGLPVEAAQARDEELGRINELLARADA